MRDTGLDEAIRAAGGVGALARKIGISQPSVSNWSRIPAERVLSRRGGDRHRSQRAAARSLQRAVSGCRRPRRGRRRARAGIRAARRAACRARPTRRCWIDWPRCAATRRRSASRMRRSRKRRAAPRSSASSASTSISSSGSGAGNCCPTARIISPASCTSARWRGCASELARARHRARRGRSRAGRSRGDPVRDHGRPDRADGCRPQPGADRELFEKHLAPWIGRFFADLEQAEAADFYRHVGTLGRAVRGHRDRGFRAAVLSGGRKRDQGRYGDETRTQGEWARPA